MEHIAALILLIGCNDSTTNCVELAAPTVGYETVQQCEEDVAPALRMAGKSYPLVIAQCVPVDPLAEGDMELAWSIDAQGRLHAEVTPADDTLAERQTIVAQISDTGKLSRLR